MSIRSKIALPALVLCVAGVLFEGWLLGWALRTPEPVEPARSGPPIHASFLIGGLCCVVGLILTRRAHLLAGQLTSLSETVQGLIAEASGKAPSPLAAGDEVATLSGSVHEIGMVVRHSLKARQDFERTAFEDALTGTLNRRGLHDRFTALMAGGPEKIGTLFGLMHVDLDHFKTINDTIGHDAGDFVLKEASARMRRVIGAGTLLSRIGGDEFVMIVPDVDGAVALGDLAAQIVSDFQAPIIYGDVVCRVGASVGTVTCRSDDDLIDLDRLLIDADTALCQAKSGGRNRCVAFQPEMARQIADQRDRAAEIRHGLLHDQFRPWFQPMVNAVTGEVIGVEVLSRWEHPTRGVVLPREFLPAAEAHNMIEEVGSQVLEAACHAISDWRRAGRRVPRLHVNMCRAELIAPAIVDKISWILDDTNMDPAHVAIEISEVDCAGRSVDLIYANLRRLSDIGVEIVLDGFGSTTGSATNLIRLGVRRMKCNRHLLERAEGREATAKLAMLRSAVSLGHSLGIAVVCKGVESADQVDAMVAEGFSEMQGDYFAPVLSVADTGEWLRKHQRETKAASA